MRSAAYLQEPPPFPRIAHLSGSRRTSRDDLGLPAPWSPATLVVVEEKLDGSNVAVWLSGPAGIMVAGRAGLGAQDRSGQLGRLRAWVHERREALTALLLPGEVLYGEWLWLRHTLLYDALPDWLVGLDLWSADEGFVDHGRRDRRLSEVGIASVPVVFEGRLGDFDLRALGRSAYGTERMEGVVIRREAEGRLLERAKWVRDDFRPKPDVAWKLPRVHNGLRAA